jgi:hypothetical protein
VVVRRGGEAQRFDIRRLRSLVGELPFDGGYPTRVLERNVPAMAVDIVD